jgi:two-component system NtrC family response regulator
MIIETSKLSSELKDSLNQEIAELLKIKPEQLTLFGIVIQLRNKAYNLEQIEKQALLQAYISVSGNVSKTASLLGVTRKTVYSLLKKHQIDSLLNINE